MYLCQIIWCDGMPKYVTCTSIGAGLSDMTVCHVI